MKIKINKNWGSGFLTGIIAAIPYHFIIFFGLFALLGLEDDTVSIIEVIIMAILTAIIGAILSPVSYIIGAIFGLISIKVKSIKLRILIQTLIMTVPPTFILLLGMLGDSIDYDEGYDGSYPLLFDPAVYEEGFPWGLFLGYSIFICVLGVIIPFIQLGLERFIERKEKKERILSPDHSKRMETQVDEFEENPQAVQSIFKEHDKIVQTNTSYYRLKWESVQDPAKKNTWNWAAFFLSIFWLAFRKMYMPFVVLGIIGTLPHIPYHLVDVPDWLHLNTCFYLVISLVVGWNGNRWYYNYSSRVLKQAKALPKDQQESHLRKEGGTHVGIMLGLSALLLVFNFITLIGLYLIPTKTNVKDVLRLSDEAINLESLNDEPKWKYVKKEGNHHVVEFTGYDYSENENVRIIFYVYFDEDTYEWKQVYINGKKLSKKEAKDYKSRIVEESSY